MKYIFGILVAFTVIVIAPSCDSAPEESFETLSTADSLALGEQLFDSMRAEVYDGYDRSIPYDYEDEVISCYPTPNLKIRFNEKGDHMIRNELNGKITDVVFEYLGHNRKINDIQSYYPLYSRISIPEIEAQIDQAEEDAKKVESTPNASQEWIDFKWMIVAEWKKKRIALETMGVAELPEIHATARIELNYPENFKRKDAILDSIFLAVYQLRDEASFEYFKKPYLELYYDYTKSDSLADKFGALKILHPIRVLDIPYCDKNKIYYYGRRSNDVPPPPPPPVEVE